MNESTEAFPKVLIVDLSKYYGGSASRVLSQLTRAKGKIALAGLKGSFLTEQASSLGLPVHIVGTSKTDPFLLFRLIRLIRKEGFQVLDSQNIQSKFWSSIASLFTKVALISTINSWYENEHGGASLKGRIYTRLELLTNKNLGLYITVSEKDRLSLIRSGIPAEKIRLIYNAVEVDPSTVMGDRQWLETTFNIPPGSMVCTAVGRLVPVKGYDILIEAIRRALEKYPSLFCLIVGNGECEEDLTRQIQDAHLEKQVHLGGFQDKRSVLSILNSSDIFAMPSRYEGTPIALLEAAAMGLPIIATSGGGIPELVSDQKEAILVPPEDPESLAQGLLLLSKDRDLARTLGKNAQLKVQQFFDVGSQVKATWDAYKSVVAARSSGLN